MSIFMTLRIALKALNRNKMRTILTMLGMIIGVGAVITMVGLGTGARTTIEERVKSAGTNMIMVIAGNQNCSTKVQGPDTILPLIRSWPTKYGAFFTQQDVTGAQKVAVLGTV